MTPKVTIHTPLVLSLQDFIGSLEARNVSRNTIIAYQTDQRQFFTWVSENDFTVMQPGQATRGHIKDYQKQLLGHGRTGTTVARAGNSKPHTDGPPGRAGGFDWDAVVAGESRFGLCHRNGIPVNGGFSAFSGV